MTLPTRTFEIALTTNPTEAASWTDISAYVRAFSARRGRQFELDRAETGVCQLAVDNRDRRFDPTHATGPYYGNLLPMRRVRISATYAGQLYRIFTGYIEAWPQTWPQWADALVSLRGVDGLKVLAQKKLNASYSQENTGTRVGNVLNDASWTTGEAWVLGSGTNSQLGTTTILGPVGDRALDTGVSTMQAVTLSNAVALDHLRAVQDVENGLFYIRKDGAFVFRNRHARLRGYQAIMATFGDDGDELPYFDLALSYDDQRIYNDIRVTREGGTAQTDSDATSQNRYFPRTLERSGLLLVDPNEVEAKAMAHWLLRTYKEPGVRVESIVLKPERDPDVMWPLVLNLELGDRVIVKRRPPGGGAAISQESIVEAINHDLPMSRDWTVTLQLSPADTTAYWVLGDANYSQLGTTTILAY